MISTEPTLVVERLTKRYNQVVAVNDLCFTVYAGEIFGLLGPNGAGKTSTIRMIMDIFKPDDGSIKILGEPPGKTAAHIGYLPEERGLYQEQSIEEVLTFLARLKGLSRTDAQEQTALWLERVELAHRIKDQVNSLSRGMQQKLQVAAAFIHDPALVILDEPFQGLDPVNVELVKRIMREEQQAGKTIVLSAHQMNLVEALCDRILLINHGQRLLYGPVQTIKRDYAPNQVRVRTTEQLATADVGKVEQFVVREHDYLITLAEGTSAQMLLTNLLQQGVEILAFEVAETPLDEIFVALVGQGQANQQESAGA